MFGQDFFGLKAFTADQGAVGDVPAEAAPLIEGAAGCSPYLARLIEQEANVQVLQEADREREQVVADLNALATSVPMAPNPAIPTLSG